MKLFFHDTETTGIEVEDRLIESAHLVVDTENKMGAYWHKDLCKAPLPIKPAAAMVHGYSNAMVKNKPSFQETLSFEVLNEIAKSDEYVYVAHNAPFDLEMISKEGIEIPLYKVIDTLQVAKHLYGNDENIEMLKLQYLRYFWELDETKEWKEAKKRLGIKEIQPHTALSDIFVLWQVFEKMKKDNNLTINKMIRLSHKPAIIDKISFGNVFEKGTKISEAINQTYMQYGKEKTGLSYLIWVFNNMELDPNIKYTIAHFIGEYAINNNVYITNDIKKVLFYSLLFEKDNNKVKKLESIVGAEKEKALKQIEKFFDLSKEEKEANKGKANNIQMVKRFWHYIST